jgi:hypothetical protein
MTFSEKYGFKPKRIIKQIDSIDTPLRNGLWNVIYYRYLQDLKRKSYFSQLEKTERLIISIIWSDFYKLPLDDIPTPNDMTLRFIKKKFFDCNWNEAYDMIQFCANLNDDKSNSEFKIDCNQILERELSAYRFVGNEIAPITSEVEINEIDKATMPEDTASTHLKTALKFLSDKESPDYRNSIKESISSVEAICGIVANKPKATLGEALDEINKSGVIELHPALNAAFNKLYGFTSDKGGIRHALLDEINELKQEDAVFMLVACSAFVNYLKVKKSRMNS